MSDYRTRNRTILIKEESTPGTDAAPTVGADAVLVEEPSIQGGLEALETNEVTGSLSSRAAAPGGGGSTFGATINLKGAGTGGNAPEYHQFLKSCGLAETLLGADITGTAQSGGANTITLAVGDGANVEIGHVVETTGGTGDGQIRVVTAVAGDQLTVFPAWTTQPDGTTTYNVRASALYVPATTGIPHATVYDYVHSSTTGVNSKLRKVLGWQGNLELSFPNAQLAKATINGSGKFAKPTDVAHPGSATYLAQRPVFFAGADISLNGVTTKFNELTLDLGNNVVQGDDPGDTFGRDVGQLTVRRVTGRINPDMTLASSRDTWQDFLDSAKRKLWVRYGTPGNGISLYIPEVQYTGSEDEDINDLMHEGIPFAADGIDTELYLNIY